MAFWTKKPEISSAQTGTSTVISTAVSAVSSAAGAAPEVASAKPAASSSAVSASPGEPAATRSAIRTAIGAGTKIQGKLNFDTPVQIDGLVKGEIFSSKQLIIGKSAQIEAAIVAPSITVSGSVSGQITVSERIEIKPGGVVSGMVYAPTLVLEEGGTLNAKVSMGLAILAEVTLAERVEKTAHGDKVERSGALAQRASGALDTKLPSNSQMH